MILPFYFALVFLISESRELPREKLSDYHFFQGKLALLDPMPGVVPYSLNAPLFSNYAEKTRFVKIPADTKAIYNDSAALEFPEGTWLIKNFYYYNDARDRSKGRRLLETRLLVRNGEEWEAWPYIWNAEQTEAYYSVAGENFVVDYVNAKGKRLTTQYRSPNKNECKGCHSRAGKLVPLGPTARNLNKDESYEVGIENQLRHWKRARMLAGDVFDVPRLENPEDTYALLEGRARAYLDVNCGNCHNRLGPANTSGLFLDWKESDPAHLGIKKSPVAAGRGSGDFLYDIDPGHPERSILVYRMKTVDPGIAMPEIGREQIHKEGVKLIEDWIKTLKK